MAPSERDPLLPKRRASTAEEAIEEIEDVNSEPLAPGKLEGRDLVVALAMPIFGILIVALDVTLTSTISAAVASEFSSLSLVSWLGSAYLVAMTIVQSLSGSLSDRFGRRSGFFVGLVLFGVGNLMCGLASNATMMIAGRAVAGAGGGAVNSITTFVTSDLVPLRRRPIWQGLTNIAWAVGMGSGGVFGGVINDLIGWRWAFLALMPLTVLVGVASYFTFVRGLPYPSDMGDNKQSQSIDYMGSITLTGLLICFVLGLNLTEEGLPKDPKTLKLVASLLSAAVLFLCAFVAVEKWFASNPVIPLHLLSNISVSSSCVSGFFLGGSMQTLLYYTPLLIQVQGYSTSEVGLQLLGEPVGAAVGPFMVGLAIRELGSYALLKPISWAVYIVSPLIFYLSNLNTPIWTTLLGMVALGAGFGSVLTVNLTGLLANVEQRYNAKSTAMAYVFRQSGASLGLAVAGMIFRAGVASEHRHAGSIDVQIVPDSIADRCNRHNFVGGERPAMCVGYANALHSVFLFTLIAGIAGLVLGLLIKSQPLDREEAVKNARVDRRFSIS